MKIDKKDFEEMKSFHDKLIAERDSLEQEIKRLKKRKERLNDAIGKYGDSIVTVKNILEDLGMI